MATTGSSFVGLLLLLVCLASCGSSLGIESGSRDVALRDASHRTLHLTKRQASGIHSTEEAALLALLDVVPTADRRSSATLLDRLFNTIDLNEDRLIDVREFETVLRMVATMNRHPSFV